MCITPTSTTSYPISVTVSNRSFPESIESTIELDMVGSFQIHHMVRADEVLAPSKSIQLEASTNITIGLLDLRVHTQTDLRASPQEIDDCGTRNDSLASTHSVDSLDLHSLGLYGNSCPEQPPTPEQQQTKGCSWLASRSPTSSSRRGSWTPDENVQQCGGCLAGFSLVKRRHHCRRCGGIFCDACTKNRSVLLDAGYGTPVRCCNTCHELQTITDRISAAKPISISAGMAIDVPSSPMSVQDFGIKKAADADATSSGYESFPFTPSPDNDFTPPHLLMEKQRLSLHEISPEVGRPPCLERSYWPPPI
jgi:hypothetical protein